MGDSQPQQTPPTQARKKTACAECRQQKMRCEEDPTAVDSPACSRCQRLKIPCVYLAPFKRTHKGKRLQELEEETTALKRRLLSASPAIPSRSQPRDEILPREHQETTGIPQAPSPRPINRNELSVDHTPTLSRTIDGLELAPSIIDDCFELFFKNYHPLLPILDPNVPPNTFYQHAPFLFWVVVSIGSRRYSRQPTLTQVLSVPVIQLTLQSIIIRAKPVERIKGLLLLLNWPFPTGPFTRDISFILAGALLHMAMYCGLHAPTFSQDFSKSYLKLPEHELVRRAEIWAYVVIMYQRTCSGSGQANLVSFEVYNEQAHFKTLVEKLPPTLRIQLRISSIISRSHKTLLDLGLLSMTLQQERTMDALLKGFNSELDSLENSALSVWDRLYLASARQDLAAIAFYKSAETLDMQDCMSIFDASASVLEQIRDLDRNYDLHRVCTRTILTITLQGLASMVRILKGPFAGYLDQIRGYNLYDSGIRFARSCSIQTMDFSDRIAKFADQIWKSKKVFRNPDGSINITLRVRNRLSGGPLHDAIRCWKEEFYDPEYMHATSSLDIDPAIPSSVTPGLNATLAPNSLPSGAQSNFSTMQDFMLNDELWGDLGLELSDNWNMTGSNTSWMA